MDNKSGCVWVGVEDNSTVLVHYNEYDIELYRIVLDKKGTREVIKIIQSNLDRGFLK